MRVGIHQPHYFPWLGYFDKIARCDTFVILDTVQFEKGSQMIRNRVLCNGNIKYLTISANMKDFLDRPYSDIEIKEKEVWSKNHLNALQNYYRKSKFFDEAYSFVESFLCNDYPTLCEWTTNSIYVIKDLLDIQTDIVMQSSIDYDKKLKQSDLVMDICKCLGADTYVSGKGGSVKYLNKKKFKESGINIEYQDFKHPVYTQINTVEFVPGLSILDCLFNLGIKQMKEVFWKSQIDG